MYISISVAAQLINITIQRLLFLHNQTFFNGQGPALFYNPSLTPYAIKVRFITKSNDAEWKIKLQLKGCFSSKPNYYSFDTFYAPKFV